MVTTSRLPGVLDERLSARLSRPRPLRFAVADPQSDLPGHVRAGSAVRRWGRRLVVVQDDVHALALLDEGSGVITPLLLPPGGDGRRTFGEPTGNKALKLDLEACVTLPDGRLLALGSGSTPRRERIVVVNESTAVRMVDARDLYALLRAHTDFSGSELNVEGAVVLHGALRLFQRGNGAPAGCLEPVDAMGDLDLAPLLAWLDGEGPLPALGRVVRVDLGTARGVRFGFTDAAVLPDGRVAFVAGAEDSPDSYRDGEVVGCRFGILDGESLRLTDILDEDGAPSRLKLEGIEWQGHRADGAWDFVVVADMDDPDAAAVMATLTVVDGGRAPR